MLLDRGLLVLEGSVYRLTGPIDALEVPETLHALIAAPSRRLSAEERRLLQDAAVLGKTFTKEGLGAVSGLEETQLEPLLRRPHAQGGPRRAGRPPLAGARPVRISYRISSGTSPTRRCRSAIGARATWLQPTIWRPRSRADVDEVVEVIASHYVDAFEAARTPRMPQRSKQKAQTMLVRAASAPSSLGASSEAQRYFEQAAGLNRRRRRTGRPAQPGRRDGLVRRRSRHCARLLAESIALHESAGDTHAAARVSGRLGRVDAFTGHRDEALARMERAFAVILGR